MVSAMIRFGSSVAEYPKTAGRRISSASEGIVYSRPVSTMTGPRTSRYRQATQPSGTDSSRPSTIGVALCLRCTSVSERIRSRLSPTQFTSGPVLQHALGASLGVHHDRAARGLLERERAAAALGADERL